MTSLTPEQIATLNQFAAQHGRYWKSKLRAIWTSGKDENKPILRQIRNQLGPVGLAKFRSET